MHQDGLALAQAGALVQGELGGEVVHRQRGTLVEGERVREPEHRVGAEHRELRRPAVRRDRRDPVAGRQPGALGCGDDHAGDVDPEGERRLRLELVLAPAQQQVGERHPDAVHLDQHLALTGLRVGDLAHLEVLGSGGLDDLHGSHAAKPIPHRSGPPLRRATVFVHDVLQADSTISLQNVVNAQPGRTIRAISKCIGSV